MHSAQPSLFSENQSPNEPLASRMRPNTLDEFFGQTHLLEQGNMLREMIEQDRLCSLIFWGPSGVGKTTLAHIIAHTTRAQFVSISAVMHGLKELRQVFHDAERAQRHGQKTIVFIDEIHHFNKSQQDALLPYLESGTVILIGATTENPAFELNNALRSRAKIFVLNALSEEEMLQLLMRTLKDPAAFENLTVSADEDVLRRLARHANGDARAALNTLEMWVMNAEKSAHRVHLKAPLPLGEKLTDYDKSGEAHFNLISALHKSMRKNDVNAAIYWLGRMIEGGEDPLYIARRLVRFASEDIGLADNGALNLAVNVMEACRLLGYPECDVHLTQCVIYLSVAPKSTAVYAARKAVKAELANVPHRPVPLHLRNVVLPEQEAAQITQALDFPNYYEPSESGNEAKIKARMEWLAAEKHEK